MAKKTSNEQTAQNPKAEAYEQIKKLGGDSTESIKTVKTDVGEMDIKVRAQMDFNDAFKKGGNVMERPYIYKAGVDGYPLPTQVISKITAAAYETAAAAYDATVKIIGKYVEALKAVEAL